MQKIKYDERTNGLPPERYIPGAFDRTFIKDNKDKCDWVLEWSENDQAFHQCFYDQYRRQVAIDLQNKDKEWCPDYKPVFMNVPNTYITMFCNWIDERVSGRIGARSRKITYKQMLFYAHQFNSIVDMLRIFKWNSENDGYFDTQLFLENDEYSDDYIE
jgi:hypothetical protein